jgi:hypothetical protein
LGSNTNIRVEVHGNALSLKGFQTTIVILAISALSLCQPVTAQELKDSLDPNTILRGDDQQVYDVLLNMLDRLPSYWWWSIQSSLVVGSNSMIPIALDIRIVVQWGSSSPSACKSAC